MSINKLLSGKHFTLYTSESGQVLLIVVLIMVIALTVGLALVSRSIINVKNTSNEADSQKAFQAAEAGVEIGLQKPLQTQDITISQKSLDNGATISTVLVHTIGGSTVILNDGAPVAQDQGLDVWLTNYPNYSGTPWTGQMNVYWGSKSGCQDAAIEAIVISGNSATDTNAGINRYGIDPCGSVDVSQNRIGSNNFKAAQTGGTVGNTNYNFSTAISITNGIVIRLIPLYANTPIAIAGFTNANPPAPQSFPAQGRIITATGSYGSTQRQVSFFQGYPMLPSAFYYNVFQQ